MPYDPKIHHRRSIRLKGYDYSQSGYYFITLCVKNRKCLFGEVVDHQMVLNAAGSAIEKWFHELEHKYPDIECGEYVVMPNHFHCIIFNNGKGNPGMKPVGANLCVCPDEKKKGNRVGADLRVCPQEIEGGKHIGLPVRPEDLGEHVGSPLRNVVQWFKTMTTNEYIRGVKTLGWKRFERKLWHINYWEHIIRTQQSFDLIASYILENPEKWDTDKP